MSPKMLRRVFRSWHHRRCVRAVCGVAIALLMLGPARVVARAAGEAPIRGYWITRDSLGSLDAIRRSVAFARANAFDTIFVPITLTDGDNAPNGFDGVRECIRESRERGLHVQAWIDVNRVARVDEFPASRAHVIYEHPEWLMIPRELASAMMSIDPRGPAYLGQLSRWTRANRSRIDGLYISPLDPDTVSYLTKLVTAAVQRYGVDGVYLDALRFPGSDFDYSRHAIDLFRADERPRLPIRERARLDEIEAIDPFGYVSEFPTEWTTFRETRLTALITRVHAALKAVNPSLTITVNIPVDDGSARAEHFQDWRSWIAARLVDGVGRRSGNTTTVVLTSDGVVSGSPILPPNGPVATAGGGSR